jgi:hypothetical protein
VNLTRGNTELSRESEPITEIESVEGDREWVRWNFMASNGKKIEAYDEMGENGWQPWLAVFSKDGKCLFRVPAHRALIFYQYRPR